MSGMSKHHHFPASQNPQRGSNLLLQASGSVQISKGPLPTPETLAGYEQACPGAADRIIKMAEAEQTHRHIQEARSLRHSTSLVALGQIIGCGIAIVGLCCGTYLVAQGKSVSGLTYFAGTLVSLAWAHIYGRRSASKDMSAHREEQTTQNVPR